VAGCAGGALGTAEQGIDARPGTRTAPARLAIVMDGRRPGAGLRRHGDGGHLGQLAIDQHPGTGQGLRLLEFRERLGHGATLLTRHAGAGRPGTMVIADGEECLRKMSG